LLVLQRDINVILLEAGQFRLDIEMIGVFTDIDEVRGQSLATVSLRGTEKPAQHRIEFPLNLLVRIGVI
jgi:hypothetical protein